LEWTETVVSRPDSAAVIVVDTAVPTAGEVLVVPDASDVVAAGTVAAGAEEVVVQPAAQANRMTSTAIPMRATRDFIMDTIYKMI
jgi:hypothetical protein